MRMKKKFCPFCLAVLCLLFVFPSCASSKNSQEFYLYFKDISRDSLKQVPAEIGADMDQASLISSVFYSLKSSAADSFGCTSPIPPDLKLLSFVLEKNDLILDFSQQYPKAPSKEELLLRASLVLTYMQLDDISTVEIRIEGQPLTAEDGTVTGPQNAQAFSDVIGRGINGFSSSDVTLYFADESGTHLKAVQETITYPGTISLQQALVNRLIQGPKSSDEGCYPVLPANTKLISVTAKDGICHVNLNSELLNESIGVSPQVEIYALVNTLTETRNVSSVMISVNGSSNLVFADMIDFSSALSRDLDLLENHPEKTE